MRSSNTIVFDCERMGYPYTGLYYFCDNLARHLAVEAQHHPEQLMFYVRNNEIKRWGEQYLYKHLTKLHKLYIPCAAHTKLWHVCFQLSSYIPKGRKVLITVHDLNFLVEKSGAKQAKYLKKLQKIINKTDAIVTISEFVKRDLLNHIDIKGKPVSVIYNGCPRYEGQIVAPPHPPPRPFLLALGTVFPKKNFHVLPCLLKDGDMDLVIIGLRFAYEAQIMQEAYKAGVSDRVHFTGAVSEAQKHWYLAHCKAFLFPSLAEGFGLPVVEAMYYQKPVFLSDHTSLPEIGGDMAYYFTDFEERAMRKVFQNGMAHFERGGMDKEKMRARALSFSWESAARSYWQCYRNLLDS